MKKHPNNLIYEKSPYLLQHAYNPVDWYAWGQEAFDKAKHENKPIFLSIGYSTCHWCHVMEHESFEDAEVALLMNEVFISIKVDREERPDIDNIYMAVCQAMTGSGGWPLTIIMTPDKKPFYSATYMPKESRQGMIGMMELTKQIKELWKTRFEEIVQSAEQISSVFQQINNTSPGKDLDERTLTTAYKQFLQRFDQDYGGFGNAPKFPTPHNLFFLLRYWNRTGNEQALKIVEKTLQTMRLGGIYDHIGFGFHRYSTDKEWLLPHFEKMLYDQALLAMAYTETFQATGKEEYRKTAQEIFSYVLRDMTSPSGGFYSAEDADSERVEGKFYLWTEKEIRYTLGKEEADLIMSVYNVKPTGNFEEHNFGNITNANILHLKKSLSNIATELKTTEHTLFKRLETIRMKLFETREKRIHPHKDDKILTDWNGLMIAALAKAGQAFDEHSYINAARQAMEFIIKNMQSPDGKLLHRYRDGEAAIPAFIDDYVFLIWGLLELYEATFDVSYLSYALELNNDAIRYFWDDKTGGFYFTAKDSEQLIIKQKEFYDGAIPSGNSVAMLNLFRLGRITANPGLEEKAHSIGRLFSNMVNETPLGYPQLLVGVDFGIGPSYEIVIAGNPKTQDTKEMINAIRQHFIPNKIVLLNPTEQASPNIHTIAPFTKHQVCINGKATAYVCQNFACKEPTTDINTMLEMLNVRKT